MNNKIHLFDFDGVLVDSMPYWSEKMINILRITNTDYPDDIIKIITPLGDRGTAEYFRDVLKIDLTIEQMYAHMDAYALPKYRDVICLKDGVYEYLQLLKENNCSINILTASPHKMVDPCLKRLGIFDWFDHIWTCEDFNMAKSDVRIYKEAAKCLNCKTSELVFFDDNIVALRTASQAGLYTIGVYDKTSEDFIREVTNASNQYIYSFGELNLPTKVAQKNTKKQ